MPRIYRKKTVKYPRIASLREVSIAFNSARSTLEKRFKENSDIGSSQGRKLAVLVIEEKYLDSRKFQSNKLKNMPRDIL